MGKLHRLRRSVFTNKVRVLDPVSQDIAALAGSATYGKALTSLRFYAGIGEVHPFEVVIGDDVYKSVGGEVSLLVERGSTVSFTAQAEGCLSVSGTVEVLQVNAEVGLPRFVSVPAGSAPTPDPDPTPDPEPVKQYTVSVTVTPAEAAVVLGSEQGVGSVSGLFDEGSSVSYNASLEGYVSQEGSVVVSKDETLVLVLEAVQPDDSEVVSPADVVVGGSNDFTGKSVTISELPDLSGATAKTTISAESIVLNSGFTSPRVVSLVADKDITVAGSASAPLVIDGVQPKTQGNATLSLNAKGAVTVKDVTFAKDDGAYNALEIGLLADGAPASVVVEGVNFNGALKNNGISIFGTAVGATVTVRDCRFKSCSNAVRLSNKLNVSGVSVVFENCVLEDCIETGSYRGFLLLEDYTSGSASAAKTNNLFGPDKLSVKFVNCKIGVGADAQVIDFASDPAAGAPFAGGDVNPQQAYYTFYDKGFGDVTGPVPYSAENYPTFSFN